MTLYDADGWMPVNDLDAYCYNNVTADRNDDGTVTIHFGGDPNQSNYLPIVPGLELRRSVCTGPDPRSSTAPGPSPSRTRRLSELAHNHQAAVDGASTEGWSDTWRSGS